jgi:phage-related protein
MKDCYFIGSSLKDLKEFPKEVRQEAGFAIRAAQEGGKSVNAVPLVGFGGAKVLEVIIPHDGDAYRAVYTVKFKKAVYVLHAFQKKSKKGIATPKADVELIRRRLGDAERHYRQSYDSRENEREKANERGA